MKNKTVNQYLQERFGQKVYRIAIDGGFTCPNRDGTLGNRGCRFCSQSGSGEFAGDRNLSITQQIEEGKQKIRQKMPEGEGKYIAYFQAYTGTYAPVSYLQKVYEEAIDHPEVVALSIATRPDCLPDEVLDLLQSLNERKPVWVELGLQTIHASTAEYIRRGYPLWVYDEAVRKLSARGLEVITHVILGLPHETDEMMLETVAYVGKGPINGIKLQLLHVLKGTDLEKDFENGEFETLSIEHYTDLIKACIDVLPKHIVIHRMTGDGDRKSLVAPLWSTDKKRVLNLLKQKLDLE